MTAASACAPRAIRLERLERLVAAGASSVADGLRSAAAPTFAVMALLTGFGDGGASPGPVRPRTRLRRSAEWP